MIIYSIQGQKLYESAKRGAKAALSEAAESGADLSHADFRQWNLSGAVLDGLCAPGACFWGADLSRADMSGADLRDCDFRGAILKQTCLAESRCDGANFGGAYFGETILRGCGLQGAEFSCPSLFSCDLEDGLVLDAALYRHNEVRVPLDPLPLVIGAGGRRLVICGDKILHNGALHNGHAMNVALRNRLRCIEATIGKFLAA